MAEEVEENIKVVVRVRDLIAREKDQPKVNISSLTSNFVKLSSFPGIHGRRCHGDHPEVHQQNVELRPSLQPCGGQPVHLR